jgi:hypothetical protein
MKNKKKLKDGRLTAQCIHCGRTIVSMTSHQLEWNLEMHEDRCPFKELNQKEAKK